MRQNKPITLVPPSQSNLKVAHHPMTKDQREILDRDLAAIMKNLGDIAVLLCACYGDDDPRVERAGQAQGAVQRLLWAVEQRTQQAPGGTRFRCE